MKIFLDDDRMAPNGWVRCYWPSEVIAILEKENVTHLSLDHDLGDDKKGTGYDVLTYIEGKVFNNPEYNVPVIIIHSQNSSAANKMRLSLLSIKKYSKPFLAVMAPYNPECFHYK